MTDVQDVRETFGKWLHLPDPGPVDAVLGTVAANRMAGDPTWTLVVAPPATGKTEIIGAVSGLAEVKFTATLTEAALLSGTPKKDKAKDATGGLLRDIGEYGIIVAKDFTSVLSMARDSRGQVLAALREVYDGSWTRHVGTDGGRALHWSGKCGLIAGCTPTIDRHHAVMGAMGERFALYRLPEVEGKAQARQRLNHAGREAEMRADLADVVTSLFADTHLPEKPPAVSAYDRERLITLGSFAVRARSAVERDGYTREVELIPAAEGPARLAVMLQQVLSAMRVIGVPEADAWRVTTKLALDSIPAIRRRVIEYLADRQDLATTTDVADGCGYPPRTAERALEDLVAHGLVVRKASPNRWRLTDWAAAEWFQIRSADIPKPLSKPFTTPNTAVGGISAETGDAP